ncbi:MAG: hypothetical protein KF722_01980 [Nitrospira sp.]|nr:hypothetical protein [Nitrospira sp.]
MPGPFGSRNLAFQQQLANMLYRGEILPALLLSLGINPVGGLGAGPTGKVSLEAIKELDKSLKISPKIAKQMGPRGWTPKAIKEAVKSGRQVPAINKATGNPATRYVNPTTGQSVVIDNVTREVIHVGGPGFKYGPGSGDLP